MTASVQEELADNISEQLGPGVVDGV